jgi:hypothetical protein
MRLISFICCELALQDVRLNTMSLINIYEELSSIAFPIAIPRLTAFAYLEREEGEPENQPCRLRATLNDQEVIDLPTNTEFQGKLRARMVAEMQGFPVAVPGDLKFALLAGDPLIEVGSWIIKIAPAGKPKVDLFSAGPTGPSGPQAAAT